jgi:hypothetical protein
LAVAKLNLAGVAMTVVKKARSYHLLNEAKIRQAKYVERTNCDDERTNEENLAHIQQISYKPLTIVWFFFYIVYFHRFFRLLNDFINILINFNIL